MVVAEYFTFSPQSLALSHFKMDDDDDDISYEEVARQKISQFRKKFTKLPGFSVSLPSSTSSSSTAFSSHKRCQSDPLSIHIDVSLPVVPSPSRFPSHFTFSDNHIKKSQKVRSQPPNLGHWSTFPASAVKMLNKSDILDLFKQKKAEKEKVKEKENTLKVKKALQRASSAPSVGKEPSTTSFASEFEKLTLERSESEKKMKELKPKSQPEKLSSRSTFKYHAPSSSVSGLPSSSTSSCSSSSSSSTAHSSLARAGAASLYVSSKIPKASGEKSLSVYEQKPQFQYSASSFSNKSYQEYLSYEQAKTQSYLSSKPSSVSSKKESYERDNLSAYIKNTPYLYY